MIRDVVAAFRSGKKSVVDYVESFLETIHRVEKDINAFIYIRDTEAILREAEEWEKRYKSQNDVPPLAGIPVAIKDNISVADMPLTCASKILEDFITPYDATAVKRLKDAGAIIIGKTNMDEFAMGSATQFSAFGGTKNPIDLERVPGGSSGGSAAAVAAGEVPVALGSDTGGSVRQPAAFTGTVGLKPSYGAVSRFGLVAFASSLDQIGVIASDVDDVAIVSRVIYGKDSMDATSADIRMMPPLAPVKVSKSVKIGLWKELSKYPPGDSIMEVYDEFIRQIVGKFQVVDVSLPSLGLGVAAYYLIAPAEASSNLARYDGVRYSWRDYSVSSYREMVKKVRTEGFGEEVKRRIMLGTFALSAGYQDALYKKAVAVRGLIAGEFERAFSEVDVILMPTSPVLPWRIDAKMKPSEVYKADLYTIPVNLAGLPAISLPIGEVDGLPVGLQVIAPWGKDEYLLSVARLFETFRR